MRKYSLPVLKKLQLLIIVVLGISNANAQWITNGPTHGLFVGYISSLAVNGSNIFAGTDGGGIDLSTNNGRNWKAVDSGLTSGTVFSLATSDSNIFAGTAYLAGIFLSTNNGHNWNAVDSGIPNLPVISLVISGSNIFAGTEAGGVFLSTNYGSNWASIDSGLPAYNNINSLAINSSNIFASTGDSGVYLSNNNGGNWIPINNGLPNGGCGSLVISGSNIFAGTSSGVYLSTNNVSTWKAMNNGLSDSIVEHLAIYGSNIVANTYDGSLFLSANNGGNWLNIGLTDFCIGSLAINDSNIFAGTCDSGVWQLPLANITGIQETPAAQNIFTLFPNPASNNFIIETNINEKQLLQVFDITGKVVLTQTITNNKTTIDASNLSGGIYCARLLSDDGVENTKLVIVR